MVCGMRVLAVGGSWAAKLAATAIVEKGLFGPCGLLKSQVCEPAGVSMAVRIAYEWCVFYAVTLGGPGLCYFCALETWHCAFGAYS